MKKIKNLFLLMLISFALVISSCNSTQDNMQMTMEKESVVYNDVESSIVAADKYGNLETDLSATMLMEEGYDYGDMVKISIGDDSYQAPIVSTYSDVDVGNFLIRIKEDNVYFAINYGNCLKKTGASEGTKIVISMVNKGSYLLEYQTRHLTKSEERSDYDSDEMFANFRTISAGDIKSGIVYRSCNPSLADARAPYAENLAKKYGINTIINLADNEESLKEHMNTITWYKDMYEMGKVILLDMDVDYTSVDFGQKLAKGFIFLSENKGPYLIHCNEGKDRAGFAAVVLEALMNASLEEIETDYMMSYSNYYGVEKGTMQYDYIADTPFNMLKNIANGTEVKDSNLSMIAEKYLMSIGLNNSQIMAIKNNLK